MMSRASREGLVVQAGGVGAELHGVVLPGCGVGMRCGGWRSGRRAAAVTVDDGATGRGRARRRRRAGAGRAARPRSEATGGRAALDAGDLVEEGPGLVAEQVVLRRSRRPGSPSAGRPRCRGGRGRSSTWRSPSSRRLAQLRSEKRELARPVQVERRRAGRSAKSSKPSELAQAEGDPRDREGADRAGGEVGGERGDVVVLDRLAHVAELAPRRGRRSAPSGTAALGD